jgi:hypothetical protein
MFSTRVLETADPEIATVLTVITDAVYDESTRMTAMNAVTHLLDRENDIGIVNTLCAARGAMLDEVLKLSPDTAACDVSDALAVNILGEVWGGWERVDVGKALLRIALDDGQLDSLSAELRRAYEVEGVAKVVSLALLVTGMSAALARGWGDGRPGDPLRRAFGLM